MSRQTIALTAAACIVLVCCCVSCGRKKSEYARPESFIVDAQTGTYYVSNMNPAKLTTGKDTARTREDNNGYITTLDKDLQIIQHKFIEGGRDGVELSDPRGLAIVGDTLWVADIKVVRGFNKTTGKNTANVPLRDLGAISLNDVCAGPEGILFVSDMDKNKVFAIDTQNRNAVSVLAEGGELNRPNGLYWDAAEQLLYVACWDGGAIVTVNFEGEVSAFVLNPDEFSHLDGIDRDDDGNFYVSDYHGNAVYRITPDLRVEKLSVKVTTPADISLDRANNRLLIPEFTADKISTLDLSEAQ